jgi:hypothetical protein
LEIKYSKEKQPVFKVWSNIHPFLLAEKSKQGQLPVHKKMPGRKSRKTCYNYYFKEIVCFLTKQKNA